MSKTVAILGASSNRHKYGNKAVRAFVAQGYRVAPINPHEDTVEGLPAYRSVADVPFPLDMVSFYVPPDVGEGLVDEVAKAGVKEIWLNPGSESPALVARARELGLDPIIACSILGIGDAPSRY